MSGDISLETLVICDRILGYRKDFDEKLKDPVWETVSLKIKKYSIFRPKTLNHYVFKQGFSMIGVYVVAVTILAH